LAVLPRFRSEARSYFARWVARAVAITALAWLGLAGATPAWAAPSADTLRQGYSVERSGSLELTFPTAAESETRELLSSIDETWNGLAQLLGVRVSTELDLRIARNPEEMQALAPEGVRLPGYASAVAFSSRGVVLLSLTEPRSFLRPDMQKLLVHELAHVALHRAVSGNAVPRWFSEGVAVHQAGERSIARIQTLWNGVVRGRTKTLFSSLNLNEYQTQPLSCSAQ
jgi:hypothetical protein